MASYPSPPGRAPSGDPRARCTRARLLLLGAAALLTPLGSADRTAAQESPGGAGSEDGWGSPEVMELVERARATRSSQQVDSTLQSYQSRANAYVYFYIDRPDEEERTLVKADQIALEVFWEAPDRTRQRIIGRRDEKALPTNIKYHLDHLTVVQDEFGHVIRIGDGDEVSAVLHPMAPGGSALYEYRLGQQVTIRTGSTRAPVEVQEVVVRPRNPDREGFVGSVYLDRAQASIVRMTFTFTRASYVDPYLDYIRISLDHALWMDRYWLPWRQELEVRREMPVIDFLAGSVIRGRFEISDYRFNVDLFDGFFSGPKVTQVTGPALESFPFERGLFDDLNARGLASPDRIAELESQVRELGLDRVRSGLNPLRLHWPSFSEGLRFNRAEGWVFGAGSAVELGRTRLRGLAAWATGPEELQFEGSIEHDLLGGRARLVGRQNRSRDLGPFQGAPGAFNSIGALGGNDWSDPYRVDGVELGWTTRRWGPDVDVRLRMEDEDIREITVDEPLRFRPLPYVEQGPRLSLGARVDWEWENGARLAVDGSVSRFEAGVAFVGLGPPPVDVRTSGRIVVRSGWSTPAFRPGPRAETFAEAGLVFGELTFQDLFYLGGRGSFPGFDFRDRAGSEFVRFGGEIGTDLSETWLSAHVRAVAGWSGGEGPISITTSPARPTSRRPTGVDGWRASLGFGVDTLWKVLRVDFMHGFPDGRWEVVLNVRPDLAGWM